LTCRGWRREARHKGAGPRIASSTRLMKFAASSERRPRHPQNDCGAQISDSVIIGDVHRRCDARGSPGSGELCGCWRAAAGQQPHLACLLGRNPMSSEALGNRPNRLPTNLMPPPQAAGEKKKWAPRYCRELGDGLVSTRPRDAYALPSLPPAYGRGSVLAACRV